MPVAAATDAGTPAAAAEAAHSPARARDARPFTAVHGRRWACRRCRAGSGPVPAWTPPVLAAAASKRAVDRDDPDADAEALANALAWAPQSVWAAAAGIEPCAGGVGASSRR